MLYFIGAILATTVEFIVAKLMIRFTGCVWWDYSQKPLNYKGILCVESTLAWGLYTIIMFGFLHNAVMAFTNRISVETGRILSLLLTVYYVIAFVRALVGARNMKEMPGIKMVHTNEK